jgi:lipid-A-disaccharide synthase
VKFASLPNIILDQALVPEILQLEPDPDALAAAGLTLLDRSDTARAQLAGFAKIRGLMEAGTAEDPRIDPAERVLAHWSPK